MFCWWHSIFHDFTICLSKDEEDYAPCLFLAIIKERVRGGVPQMCNFPSLVLWVFFFEDSTLPEPPCAPLQL